MNLSVFLKHNPKRHVIFDLDGTLLKLHIDWSEFRRQLWDTVNMFDEALTQEVPFERWKGIELVNKAIAKHGEKAKQIIFPFNETYELTHLSGYSINTELVDFIRLNNSRYVFSLWTSNFRKTITPLLNKERLEVYFKTMVTRDDVDFIKPFPEGFERIRKTETPLSDYVMVGDNFTDEEAAKAAGIDFFRVKMEE